MRRLIFLIEMIRYLASWSFFKGADIKSTLWGLSSSWEHWFCRSARNTFRRVQFPRQFCVNQDFVMLQALLPPSSSQRPFNREVWTISAWNKAQWIITEDVIGRLVSRDTRMAYFCFSFVRMWPLSCEFRVHDRTSTIIRTIILKRYKLLHCQPFCRNRENK